MEDLEVAGRRVGLRLYPSDRALRSLAPAGIEFAPPRTERSTGPGRHDFEIVASPEISLEQDMARRDFTINAIAKRLETGELLDPFNGREDLEARVLRTVSPESFREDPLRLVRGLRFVSEHDLDPDEQTLAQMRENAESVRLVSAERIGGGLSADGMGELSKLLLGAHPAKALRLARDTGVLVELLPEFEPRLDARARHEHTSPSCRRRPTPAPLEVRLGALLHDLGKLDAETGDAELVRMRRLRPPTRCATRARCSGAWTDVVAHTRFRRHGRRSLRRRALAQLRRGDSRSTVARRLADLAARRRRADRTAMACDAARRSASDGALNRTGSTTSRSTAATCSSSGLPRGPAIGEVLATLLERVVDDPTLNTRERLLEQARGCSCDRLPLGLRRRVRGRVLDPAAAASAKGRSRR